MASCIICANTALTRPCPYAADNEVGVVICVMCRPTDLLSLQYKPFIVIVVTAH